MNSLCRQWTRLAAALLFALAGGAACRSADTSDVEVEIRSIGVDQVSRAPVILLQDKAKRVALPIWIGPNEAQAIAMQLEGITPPRPLTHDLMKSALEQAGVSFDKVVIENVRDSTYFARIFLHGNGKKVELDSRPSDAIALAVRFHKPIFVSRALLRLDTAIDLRQEALAAGALTLSGITMQDLTDDLAAYFDLPAGSGVLVSNVARDARIGLQRGDVIVEIDGKPVSGLAALQPKLDSLRPGTRADLCVRRGTKKVHVDFIAE